MIPIETLEELRKWCQPRPNAVHAVKQPRDSWANLTAALDELITLRKAIREANDCVETYEGVSLLHYMNKSSSEEGRLIAMLSEVLA